MSTSSSARMRQFWRSDWFVGACVGAAVVGLCHAAPVLSTLHLRLYELADTPSSPIAIDDRRIANAGRWPRRRDVHAEPEGLSLVTAARVHAVVQKTVPMAARHWPEGRRSGVSASSYDPAAEGALADDSSGKTAVFGRLHGPAHPPAGGGQSDSEA